jgi:hypothetical protein
MAAHGASHRIAPARTEGFALRPMPLTPLARFAVFPAHVDYLQT